MHYKTASIILNSSQNANKSVSDIFIAQPDANKEALAGKLFVLAEIIFNKSISLKLINFLVNNINHNYYQNEKIILRERISSLKVEHIFESSLAKTNKDLSDFLEREKINISPSEINITIGVIHENSLYFSSVGKNKSILIYKQKTPAKVPGSKFKKESSTEELKYKTAEIGNDDNRHNSLKSAKASSSKFFSNVLSGQIPVGGYFFFSNETLPEYISNAQLIEIITKLPPSSAAEQIKNTLSKVNAYVSFLGIIVKNTAGTFQPAAQPESVITQSASAQNSVSVLNYTETKTEKILTPYGMVNFGKWLGIPFGALSSLFKKSSAPGKNGKIFLKEKIFFRKKSAFLSIKKLCGFFLDIIFSTAGFLAMLSKTAINSDKRREFFEKLKSNLSNFTNFWIGILPWFKNLGRRYQIIIGIIMICVIAFGANITTTRIINKKQIDAKLVAELKTSIEQRQNEIDAHLLYNNEDGAKEILSEIQALIQSLPRTSEEELKFFNKVASKNEQHLEKIGHVVKIDSPEEIADLSKLNSKSGATNIILVKNKIYSADASQQTIYSIDLNDKSATAITDLKHNITTLDFPVLSGEENIYFLNGKSIILLNSKTDELSSLEIEFPDNVTISGADIYNNRFYFIDKKNNNVYRFTKDGDKLTSLYNWLQEPVDLSNSIGLSIDGNAFTALENGNVLKFLKGENVDFNLEAIEPNLQSPANLEVSADLDYLYILEPANKRLAVFNKAGNFIMQYKSDTFNDLKDFVVDEKSKKIYLLSGQIIYSIPGTHLEK